MGRVSRCLQWEGELFPFLPGAAGSGIVPLALRDERGGSLLAAAATGEAEGVEGNFLLVIVRFCHEISLVW